VKHEKLPTRRLFAALAWFGVLAVMLYIAAAWMTFQYRNPKANQMSFYRDFRAVITWQTLETYQ